MRISSRPSPGRLIAAVSLVVGACLIVIAGHPILRDQSVVPELAVTTRPIQVAEDGYASSDSCQSCHPREYATWHRSYHRTMTQVATPQALIPDFAARQVREVPGRPMLLERRGTQAWATFDDPDWDDSSPTRPRIERQIVMTTGSHHQQLYWYSTGRGRLLGQLPAEYLVQEQRWIPRSAALMHPPVTPSSETGSWNSTCIACHATAGKSRFSAPPGAAPGGALAGATQAAEFGIACEACHGPSAEHARLNRSPWRRYTLHLTGARDPLTILPNQIPSPAPSQVCGQCHSVWEFYDRAGELRANASGLPYRPGDDLTATRLVAQLTRHGESAAMADLMAKDPQFIRDSFWPDGMIRVSGREYNGLIESPCFKAATGDARRLSCFSCHDMHQPAGDPRPIGQWADGQLGQGMDGNAACLQCHRSYAKDITAHSKHAVSSSGSSCYNCHMPYTTYGLLKTLRSHQISSPSVAASLDTGRPNACNLCHLDKTLKWTAETLQAWYGAPMPVLSDDEQAFAASLLWLFRGDADQRTIVAQSMGWPPAQHASGTGWMAPYLAQLLDDQYEVLRFIVFRSLRSMPGFQDFRYEFTATREQRLAAAARAMNVWRQTRAAGGLRVDPQLLLDLEGNPKLDTVSRLVRSRDRRPLFLRE